MKTDTKFLWIRILAITGLALSIKLALIYYTANYDRYALSSFCSINDFIDCDGAARSTVSQFLGIPLAYWGIFFYVTVIFLTFVDKLKNISFLKFLEVFKEPKAYITFLGVVAFLCSMSLAFISLYGIKKLCILCVITYFIDFIISVISADGLFKNIIRDFKTTFFDFIDGVKKYTKTFVVLLLLATTILTYSEVTLNFVPHIKQKKSILKYGKIKYNPYRVQGNLLGVENPKVVIELYSDYVCPLCYINNIMLHEAAKEYTNIKIVHFNYPFDKVCNLTLEYTMHPNACFMSRVALAAERQNNYWGMASLLYENQPKNSEKVLELAEKINLDKTQLLHDIQSSEVKDRLASDIKQGIELNIDATPTMLINGEKIVGVKPYYELKAILEKHGAKRK